MIPGSFPLTTKRLCAVIKRNMSLQNIILDLDQTVICSEALEDLTEADVKRIMKYFNYQIMEPYYAVVERPHLQEFLDYIFAHYNVSVWTASSPEYSDWIVKHILIAGRPERRLHFKFDSRHCGVSKKLTKCSKKLNLLWYDYQLKGYDVHSTLLIDDHPSIYKAQKKNVLWVPEFNCLEEGSEKDKELLGIMALL